MKAMNVPKSSYPKTGKGARCDDVTSLDSWGELDEKMTAVTSQLNESPRAQISTPGNSTHTKKFADKMTDTPKRKSRSRSDLGGHSNGSPSDISNSPPALSSNRQNVKMLNQNKTSPSAGMGSYVDTKENLQVGSFEDVPVWSNTYIGSDAVVLNPLGLECMLPQNSSRHYYPAGSSDSHSLPESSVSRVSNSESIDKVNSSNKHGFLQKVKTGYLQKALQPNIDGAPSTSRPTTFGFKERKKYKDDLKHRSSESIYSSSEHAHSPVKSQATNEFTAEFEQNLLEQKEKVKTKVLSMWNNMKYGWTIKTKTQFRFDSPIYLLGKCYHIRKEEDVETDGHQPDCHRPTNPRLSYRMTEMEAFKRDFTSRLWFTYRRDFPMLPHSTFTTDCGWGCMLRSGQMMLAQAFSDHFLSRDWRLFNSQTKEQDLYHKQIIRWFGDCPSDQAPFSVHSLVQLGERTGKRPGDWYGPASVAHILKEAIVRAYEYQPILNDIAIYVSQDCTVYKQDILDVCSVRRRSSTRQASVESPTVPYVDGEPEWRRGVVILIPVRLGSDNLNPVYIPCLKSLLAQDCCLGIIGGKPRHSLYFIGWQEDKLIHLDPHYCQDVVDTKARDFPFTTYHCMSPRKMPFSKMDPSCTIGFYCKTKAEFNKFVEQTEEMVLEPKYKGMYPMFIFSEGSSGDLNLDGLSVTEDRLLRVRHINTSTKNGKSRSRTIESEEFVFL